MTGYRLTSPVGDSGAGYTLVPHDGRDKQPLEQMLAGCCASRSLVQTQLWRLLVGPFRFLKAVLLGGAAIPVELTEQAREQGCVSCGYGN